METGYEDRVRCTLREIVPMPSFMRYAGLLGALAVMTLPALAAEPKPDSTDEQKARMERLAAGNPHAVGLEDKAKKLYASLSQDEMKRLVAMQTGMQMVRAVDFVRDDVGKTVALCGKVNPPMKADMDSRFKAWQDKVMPLAGEHHKRMDAALGKQNFSDPGTVKDFLDQVDKSAKFAQEQQSKMAVRVTTPDACKALLQSMDSSSSQLAKALELIRWPGEKPSSREP